MVERAQVQAFLLGYLSGQLGLLMVPDTLLRTWSQPAGKHDKNTTMREENNEGGGGGGHVISSGGGSL